MGTVQVIFVVDLPEVTWPVPDRKWRHFPLVFSSVMSFSPQFFPYYSSTIVQNVSLCMTDRATGSDRRGGRVRACATGFSALFSVYFLVSRTFFGSIFCACPDFPLYFFPYFFSPYFFPRTFSLLFFFVLFSRNFSSYLFPYFFPLLFFSFYFLFFKNIFFYFFIGKWNVL